jgi:hypothetical protein
LISIRHRTLADLTPYYSRRLNPKMLNGARKILSNLVLNFVTYLRDTTAISKMQITFKDKARADEKAESARVLWRMSVHFEEVRNTVIGR